MAPIGQVLGCEVFSKTKMCKFHRAGKCAKGKQCPWAHDASELKELPDLRRTKICKELISTGQCTNANCTFAHSKEDWRTIASIANDATYTVQNNVLKTNSVAAAKNSASQTSNVEQTFAMHMPVLGAEAPCRIPMSFTAGVPAFVPLSSPPPGLKNYMPYSPTCGYPSFVREGSDSDCSTNDDVKIDGNTSIAQILALSLSAK